jgi:hypothetical protein
MAAVIDILKKKIHEKKNLEHYLINTKTITFGIPCITVFDKIKTTQWPESNKKMEKRLMSKSP